jgi:hypothetical protein
MVYSWRSEYLIICILLLHLINKLMGLILSKTVTLSSVTLAVVQKSGNRRKFSGETIAGNRKYQDFLLKFQSNPITGLGRL